MRKNKTMRAAALMLALTLITSCFVGGTFAKYVTEADGQATARVAKFGVELAVASDDIFKTEYAKDSTDTKYASLTTTVKSADTDELVAPGTKSQGEGMTFTISGTPEVAVDIDMVVADEYKDVFLKAGTYPDYTTDDEDTFTLDEDYHPIVWTLTLLEDESENINGTNKKVVAKGTLEEVKTKLTEYVDAAIYEPNEPLSAKFALTWEWAFDVNNNPNSCPTNDKADTFLGNVAADESFAVSATMQEGELVTKELSKDQYSTEVDLDITIKATQID